MYIIGEMAYGHDGSIDKARKIVEAAARAQANALSIHVTTVSEYLVPHYGAGPGRVSQGKELEQIYSYLERITLSYDHVSELAGYTNQLGLDLILMPNDIASFEFCKNLDPVAYIIAPTCMQERKLVEKIAQTNRSVYLRVGGSTLNEISEVVEIIQQNSNATITLLYGHQNYPTKIEDNHLMRISALLRTYGLPVGIADHTDAEDDFATILPLLAIPLGVSCIEKHLTYNRAEKGEDFESALNEGEFSLMVERVRKAESAMGQSHLLNFGADSQQYRLNTRKRVVAARDIQQDEIITEDMYNLKRSDEGILPTEIQNILGLIVKRPISKNQGLTYNLLSGPENE